MGGGGKGGGAGGGEGGGGKGGDGGGGFGGTMEKVVAHVRPDGTLVCPESLLPQQRPSPAVVTPHEW